MIIISVNDHKVLPSVIIIAVGDLTWYYHSVIIIAVSNHMVLS